MFPPYLLATLDADKEKEIRATAIFFGGEAQINDPISKSPHLSLANLLHFPCDGL